MVAVEFGFEAETAIERHSRRIGVGHLQADAAGLALRAPGDQRGEHPSPMAAPAPRRIRDDGFATEQTVMHGAIGQGGPFAGVAKSRKPGGNRNGSDDAPIDRRLFGRLALPFGDRRQPLRGRTRRYFHVRIARGGRREIGVERQGLSFGDIEQARQARVGGGRDDRRQAENRRQPPRSIQPLASGDVRVDIPRCRARRIGGVGAPRNARREAREPIAAGDFLERRPRLSQRALGAPRQGMIPRRHRLTVSTPVMTNCTASAASTTPSNRLSTTLPVVPSSPDRRSDIRNAR